MQRELASRGIASVTATRRACSARTKRSKILRILEALLAIGDENRLRAALASVLIGDDAAAIDALSRDEDAHRALARCVPALAPALAAFRATRVRRAARREGGAAAAQARRRRAAA